MNWKEVDKGEANLWMLDLPEDSLFKASIKPKKIRPNTYWEGWEKGDYANKKSTKFHLIVTYYFDGEMRTIFCRDYLTIEVAKQKAEEFLDALWWDLRTNLKMQERLVDYGVA